MKLIVTVPELRFAGRARLIGEEIEVTEKQARALQVLRKAGPPPAAPAIVGPDLFSAAEAPIDPPIEAEVEGVAEGVPEAAPAAAAVAPQRRSYRTRRLQAED